MKMWPGMEAIEMGSKEDENMWAGDVRRWSIAEQPGLWNMLESEASSLGTHVTGQLQQNPAAAGLVLLTLILLLLSYTGAGDSEWMDRQKRATTIGRLPWESDSQTIFHVNKRSMATSISSALI
jgi:hypothetical protein